MNLQVRLPIKLKVCTLWTHKLKCPIHSGVFERLFYASGSNAISEEASLISFTFCAKNNAKYRFRLKIYFSLFKNVCPVVSIIFCAKQSQQRRRRQRDVVIQERERERDCHPIPTPPFVTLFLLRQVLFRETAAPPPSPNNYFPPSTDLSLSAHAVCSLQVSHQLLSCLT